MLLQPEREVDLVVVVVGGDGGAQPLIVLLLDEQVVDGLVHWRQVVLLHAQQVLLHQRQLLRLAHDGHHAPVVDARLQHPQQVAQQVGVRLQVEADALVVHLHARHLDADVLELHVLPRVGRVGDHDGRGVVKLVVRDVQEGELLPVLELLAHTNEARNVEARGKQLEVLHEALRLVLGVQDAELGEDAHVRAFQADAALHERDKLLKVALRLVVAADLLEVVRVDNDVERAQLRQPELALVHARKAHLLPRARAVGLARRVHGRLELAQVHQRAGQPAVVGDAREEDARRLVEPLVKAAVAGRLQVGGMRAVDELLQRA
mmetsp:Transcript_2450/g.6170  ORF Transcript_2450/g.6170 Transcript_2450/m.6170 type:complete len:320 (-) Transcript_2450:3540-4499(-)